MNLKMYLVLSALFQYWGLTVNQEPKLWILGKKENILIFIIIQLCDTAGNIRMLHEKSVYFADVLN